MINRITLSLLVLFSSASAASNLNLVKEIQLPKDEFQSSFFHLFSYSNNGDSLFYIPKNSLNLMIIRDNTPSIIELKNNTYVSKQSKDNVYITDEKNELWKLTDKGNLTPLRLNNDMIWDDIFISYNENTIASRQAMVIFPFSDNQKMVPIHDFYPIFSGNSFGNTIAVTAGQMNNFFSQDTWLEVWDAQTGVQITEFDTNDDDIDGPVIVDEDKGLIFFQWDDKFTLWNYKTNTIIDSMKMDVGYGHIKKEKNHFQAYGLNSVQRFSFNNNTISRTLLCKLQSGQINTPPQFSADGKYILTKETNNNHTVDSIYSVSGNGCKQIVRLPPIFGYYALHPTQRVIASVETDRDTIKIYTW